MELIAMGALSSDLTLTGGGLRMLAFDWGADITEGNLFGVYNTDGWFTFQANMTGEYEARLTMRLKSPSTRKPKPRTTVDPIPVWIDAEHDEGNDSPWQPTACACCEVDGSSIRVSRLLMRFNEGDRFRVRVDLSQHSANVVAPGGNVNTGTFDCALELWVLGGISSLAYSTMMLKKKKVKTKKKPPLQTKKALPVRKRIWRA